jgi:hypothetical protein
MINWNNLIPVFGFASAGAALTMLGLLCFRGDAKEKDKASFAPTIKATAVIQAVLFVCLVVCAGASK